jgi:hypothetical protein
MPVRLNDGNDDMCDRHYFLTFLAETDSSQSEQIFKHSMGARNRVGIGLSYRPTRLHRLAELITWNQFLGSFKV